MRHAPTRVAALPLFVAALLLVSMAVETANGQTPSSTHPSWFDDPQFFAASYWNDPANPGLANVPFTGESVGAFLEAPSWSDFSGTQTLMRMWTDKGGHYFAYAGALDNYYSSAVPEWDSFRMRTLSGAYHDQPSDGPGGPRYSLSGKGLQDAIRTAAQRAVDLGADGIMVDNLQGQLAVMIYDTPDHAASFDAITMAAFRAYLQKKYSVDALNSEFGVADITSFDFGKYIVARGLAGTWNKYPLTGMSLEFYLFKRQESYDFLRDLVTTTKQYALQKYGRQFLFICNNSIDPTGYPLAELMDGNWTELFPIRGMNHPTMAPDIKAYKGWKTLVMALPEPMAPFAPNPLNKPTKNLARMLIADAAASGGVPTFNSEFNIGLQARQPWDASVVQRYANFILNNPYLMTQFKTGAQVALIEGGASRTGGKIPSPAENDPWGAEGSYIGTARLLIDSGITYDSVYVPDTTITQSPALTSATLAQYKVVIAPQTWALDDSQVGVLLGFAQQGGTLVVDDHFATSESDGSPANRAVVAALTASEGTKPYGAGQIVVSKSRLGWNYTQSKTPSANDGDLATQRALRAAFLALMAPFKTPDVMVTQPAALIREPGVTAYAYRDRNGSPLVHLVNYDYDDSTDQFVVKANLQVLVQVAASDVVDNVILRSPDTQMQSLAFTRSGNAIAFTMPTFESWAVVNLQRNANAPLIVSATPNVGAVGCSAVPLSVVAKDDDGNPLTYVWSVNGQIIPDVAGSTYTLQVPCDSTGAIYVTVVVSDGTKTTQYEWAINTIAYKKPRVLFDDSHAERNTIDAARASQLNPDHPGWVSFGKLASDLSAKYQLSRLTTGPITADTLSQVDALILAAPDGALSSTETTAINSFVQRGGSLMFLGDASLPTWINTLLAPWGMQFDPALVESSLDPYPYHANFSLSSWSNDPALGSSRSYRSNWGGSFALSAPARMLAATESTAWKSVSGQAERQPGDPTGSMTMIAGADYGLGHVFAISDNAFHDEYLSGWPANETLFSSALGWMTAAVNVAPSGLVLPQSGWWWDSKLNGTGFFIEQGGKSGTGMFVGGFLYDAAGGNTWLVSTGPLNGNTYTSNWLKVAGGQTLTGAYKAPTGSTSAGAVTIAFSDSTHAVMTRPDGTQINLARFSFTGSTPAAPVAGAPQSGWWWAGSSLSGSGYGIEIQGTSVFVVAYVYDDAGNPMWYLATGNLTTPSAYTGTWDVYAGGPQLTSPEGTYTTTKVAGKSVPMSLTFSDATHGTLTMGSVVIPIVRFQEF